MAALALPGWIPSASAQQVTVVPSASISETLTTRSDVNASGSQVDAVTQVSPSISVSAQGPGLRANLNYTLNALHYARADSQDSIQNSLDATLNASSLNGMFSLDARAGVSQQTISPFGTRTSDTRLNNDNTAEVYKFSLAPQFRMPVGSFAYLTASANWAQQGTSSTEFGDSASYGGGVSLAGNVGLVGWSVSLSRQTGTYNEGRRSTVDNLSLQANYQVRYDLVVGGSLGRQGNDVLSGSTTYIQTTGWNVSWQPTDRTGIALQNSRTFYGRSHSYSFNHRMATSVWSYGDSISASGVNDGLVPVALTVYDLLLANCVRSTGGTTATCDPIVRAQIAQAGLIPTTVLGVGFLNSGLTKTRAQTLNVAIIGVRATISLLAFRTSTTGIDPLATYVGGLQVGTAVRQQGFSLGATHSISETSNATLSATQSQTDSTSTQAGNTLRTLSMSYAMRPSSRTNASLTARSTRFSGGTHPYSEHAVTASVGITF